MCVCVLASYTLEICILEHFDSCLPHTPLAATGPEVYANHNAPPAVALSALIYALRAMVDKDIPLNQVSSFQLTRL